MSKNKRFFSKMTTAVTVFVSVFALCDFADAATRTNVTTRSAPVSRKNVSTAKTVATSSTTAEQVYAPETTTAETIIEPAEQSTLIISNKSTLFESTISDVMESALPDNTFAEEIRRQRAALAASDATYATTDAQKKSLAANSHDCDVGLRKCMSELCGKDFTKCATDGDTAFGDKLNRCRRNIECTGEEFSLFTAEIKADRDMNVRLVSYNSVLDCGNNYNACIVNECGTTYNKCLGKSAESAAIQKCSIIATECRDNDSGLASRFGIAMGKLRENAEIDIKKDEKRLYELRDLMAKSCKSLGATFDERSFDCVYSVEFFAGEDQSKPLASRKAYAGDSFVCMQEWFGTDVTTYRENAYRETRTQNAASSAMLGSGVGMAAGAISSGAIDRAIDTTKAKNELKDECSAQGGTLKNGECVQKETDSKKKNDKCDKVENALTMTHDKNGTCIVLTCKLGYKKNDDASACIITAAKQERETKRAERKEEKANTKTGEQTPDSSSIPSTTQPEDSTQTKREEKLVPSTASDSNINTDDNKDDTHTVSERTNESQSNMNDVHQKADQESSAEPVTSATDCDSLKKPAAIACCKIGKKWNTLMSSCDCGKGEHWNYNLATQTGHCTKIIPGSSNERHENQQTSTDDIGTNGTRVTEETPEDTSKVKKVIDRKTKTEPENNIPKRADNSAKLTTLTAQQRETEPQQQSETTTPQKNTSEGVEVYDVIVIGPKTSQNTQNSNNNKTPKTQAECEAEIDAEFANGIPSKYRYIFEHHLNNLKNTPISVQSGYTKELFHKSGKTTDRIICKENHSLLKDCENANEQLTLISKYYTQEQQKQEYCGTTNNIKTGFLETDIQPGRH